MSVTTSSTSPPGFMSIRYFKLNSVAIRKKDQGSVGHLTNTMRISTKSYSNLYVKRALSARNHPKVRG